MADLYEINVPGYVIECGYRWNFLVGVEPDWATEAPCWGVVIEEDYDVDDYVGGRVFIPCSDAEQASELARRIAEAIHDAMAKVND